MFATVRIRLDSRILERRNPFSVTVFPSSPSQAYLSPSHESSLHVIVHHSSDTCANAIGGVHIFIIQEVHGFDGAAMFLFILLMVERSFMGNVELLKCVWIHVGTSRVVSDLGAF